MQENYFKEIFEYPINEFSKHLENENNERIIFSGKYGIGKTTFLRDFFNQEDKLAKYDVYRLYPINYSISQNEDILQYIKYDILTELLLKKSSIEEFELDFIQTLPVYIKENAFKVIAEAMCMMPKVGKDIADFSATFDKLKEKFIEFHNKANEFDADIVIKYLEKLEAQEGSIYEDNIITKIISKTIKKDASKESILIVDDIDRLDPEHVFRILNVFAAHFDRPSYSDKKNKFNFDKIIIVCDFNNIRHLFHHRYGNNVDFMGYIDKFYSSEIYHLDNKRAIIGILDSLFFSITFGQLSVNEVQFFQKKYFEDDFLQRMITLLLQRNFISLRGLKKIYNKSAEYHIDTIYKIRHEPIPALWLSTTMQLKLLKDFVGDYANMKRIFIICQENNEMIEDYEIYFGFLVYFLSAEIHGFRNIRNDIDFIYKDQRMLIEPKFNFYNDRFENAALYYYEEVPSGHDRGPRFYPSIDMFWNALIDTVNKLHQVGFLN